MPALLLGLLLAAIPLAIHLLRRQQTSPIAWGAMQFLLETPLRARRRRSIDNLLLMLVRIAILALLAFALARPLLRGKSFVTNTPIDVAVVLDHSLSMGRRGDTATHTSATLFDQGVDTAQRLAAMLPPSGSIAIILAEHAPQTTTPIPIPLDTSNRALDGAARGEWSTALQQLHALPPGTTDADIPQAIQAATEVLARGRNARKMILVVSDQQRANWSIGADAPWRAALAGLRSSTPIPVFALAVKPPTNSPNLSVAAITVQPAFLGIHRPAQITATLTNTGTADLSNIPVQLQIDGRTLATQQLAALPPGKSNTIHFDEYFTDPGSHWVRVKADIVDGLEADNSAATAVTVSPRLPVLVVDGQLTASRRFPAADFILFAMTPADPSSAPDTLISPKVISVSDIDAQRLDDYPVIVLNDVPRLTAATVARLAAYAQSGHGLWILLGPRTQPSFLADVLAKSPLLPATPPSAPLTTDSPATIDIKEPDNPMVALVTAAQRNALAGATVSAWWPLTNLRLDVHTILATTSGNSAIGNGDPLVTEMALGSNGGRVILWTTAAYDPRWNNLPLVPNFTPLVNETLLHLASSQAQAQTHDLAAGDTLLWSGPASLAIQSATLVAPNGAAHNLTPELRGDRAILSYHDTHAPGLYELHFTPPTVPQPVYFTVAIDRAELDPTSLSPTDFAWLKNNHYLQDDLAPEALPKALNATVGGVEIWWLLAFLVLALLVVETFLTARQVKLQTTVDPATAGLFTPTSPLTGSVAR